MGTRSSALCLNSVTSPEGEFLTQDFLLPANHISVCVGVITHVVGPQIYPNSHIVVSVLPPGDEADSSIKPLEV